MTEGKEPARTRERVLRAAEQLFVERGYHATTLRAIADRVGITKPALYYHFDSKAAILASLLDPMTTELERVLDEAAAAGRTEGVSAARAVLIHGWVDVFLRSRGALLALVRELAATQSGAFDRMIAAMERAITVGAGSGGVAEQVAVTQAISAISDPVALLPHIPGEVLREHLVAGAWRLLGERTRPSGRGRGGRPRSLSAEDVALARELHSAGRHSPESIAERFGVSRATMYRHLKT